MKGFDRFLWLFSFLQWTSKLPEWRKATSRRLVCITFLCSCSRISLVRVFNIQRKSYGVFNQHLIDLLNLRKDSNLSLVISYYSFRTFPHTLSEVSLRLYDYGVLELSVIHLLSKWMLHSIFRLIQNIIDSDKEYNNKISNIVIYLDLNSGNTLNEDMELSRK